MNLLTIFLTGLFTGGLTCLAVQGGLLATTIAQKQQKKLENELESTGHALPIILFLTSKLIAYTIFGFMLGWLGSLFRLSLPTQVILQIAVSVFMIGTALSILNVHPVFRYFIISPPRFLLRLIRNQTKSKDFFAPFLLGAFTVFIPCGTTQAMMALSVASGNPLSGALIMFIFILGTSPLFFILGYLATKIGHAFQARFMKLVAYAIIFLAIFNINSAITLSGSKLTLQNIWKEFYCTAIAFCNNSLIASATSPVDNATIYLHDLGYTPNSVTVKTGTQITLNLVNKEGRGCIQAFTIPKMGIQKIVPIGTSQTVEFKTPDKPQDIAFMCSMGMYQGVIKVI